MARPDVTFRNDPGRSKRSMPAGRGVAKSPSIEATSSFARAMPLLQCTENAEMQSKTQKSSATVAVVGIGYWGKNLVRNFHELGALGALCDERPAVEASYKTQLSDVAFHQDYSRVL